jgi:hypothetical protein
LLEREDLGELLCASATVTMFSNSSNGLASAVHNSLALFSYMTWETICAVRVEIICAASASNIVQSIKFQMKWKFIPVINIKKVTVHYNEPFYIYIQI